MCTVTAIARIAPTASMARLRGSHQANGGTARLLPAGQPRIRRRMKLDEERRQGDIGGADGIWPVEPCNVLALAGRRARLTVCPQEEAHVEVLVPLGRGVDVDMHRVLDARPRRQSCLLRRLPDRCGEQLLAWVNVASGLDPD